MNLKEIKEMINLMNENNLAELEIEREGLKFRIRKQGKTSGSGRGEVVSDDEYVVEHAPVSKGVQAPKEAKGAGNIVEIKSPMVGTFYRSPTPEAAPFAETGQNVEVGQVVCIVEAMKLMNEIKSEVKGKIKEVLADNGDPVEFGQPLFLVEVS